MPVKTGSEVVFTSKGPRRLANVRQLTGGSRVRRIGRAWEARGRSDVNWRSISAPIAPAEHAEQAPAGGWISWADWQTVSATPVASFSAAWTVPPPPTTAGGQLIYLFNGLQDAAGQHILQPVLQWGTSPAAGSGDHWGLASFWVGSENDPMFCSPWVAVQPGTAVTGRMNVVAQANGLFSCTCAFDGFPATELTAENLPELVDCVLTLEAYGIAADAPYPSVAYTDFVQVAVTTRDATPAVQWQASGGALVQADGGVDGSVRVVYPQGAIA